MRLLIALLAAAAALAPAAANAQAAVVEGVQMPAWLERTEGGALRRTPLAVGTALRRGDVVRTGEGSRALLKLAEGSTVKLGANASFAITAIEAPEQGIFRATLRVLEGAFRFTTDALAPARRREVSIGVSTSVTAGIRGTDLWGKSSAERQIVCLIEGRVEVGAAGEAPIVMDQPRQFYRRENGVTQPVGLVTPEQLGNWAKETDIEAGAGAARRGGRWQVTLAERPERAAALALREALGEAGFAAQLREARTERGTVYRVRIASLPSREEAEALGARLRGRYGVESPAVSQ